MNIVLLGSNGRLGSLIHNQLNAENIPTFALAKEILATKKDFQNFFSNLPENAIILDVSLPTGTEHLIEQVKQLNSEIKNKLKGIVIGTTGHTNAQQEKIKDLSKEIPICLVSNFSKGVFLFDQILNAKTSNGMTVCELAHSLGFDLALNEIHHTQKKDAPSGTAVSLANTANLPLERISSTRVGNVIGEHTLYFSQDSEMLEIKHSAHSRKLFALGAIQICKNIIAKSPNAGLLAKEEFFT
ncbi:dihydrodipicolinate reductase C-terminal domain-containing protein [Pigmentibacter sp. JX0631]|uniref:4-hydroxy-tetrahydrodipicolinate reductase n=1 Tax=Pigmentibacter sp. JX0631 TaxID=2976982 RepID=UPI002468A02F|nr:dihydrodipicolinate reductase C-terminal domain-containing protein [Pigmentibacter sp. JX0631]WGL60784.1 dihydrodipicolinate reductase C-terminal domain-containing protein [Pigmentibacter sp. JX0631]